MEKKWDFALGINDTTEPGFSFVSRAWTAAAGSMGGAANPLGAGGMHCVFGFLFVGGMTG